MQRQQFLKESRSTGSELKNFHLQQYLRYPVMFVGLPKEGVTCNVHWKFRALTSGSMPTTSDDLCAC